jgi:IS605 OrfB family transposase
MQTLKFKIEHKYNDLIIEYQKQYSILLHSAFNYFNNLNAELSVISNYITNNSDLIQKLKDLNNVELINSWFTQSAIKEAYQLFKSYQCKLNEYNQKLDRKHELLNKQSLTYLEKKELKKLNKINKPKVIFGGKTNFIQRCKQQISKDEFKLKRLNSLYSIGTAKPYKGNRFFRISEDLTKIIFQPKCKEKYELTLIGVTKGYKQILSKLYIHQSNKDLPITYKLSTEYIYISFEEDKLYKDEFNFKKIKDRYCALDLNPNYIGYSIIDWKSSNDFKIIDSGVYSFKELNDLYFDLKGTNSSDKKKIWLNNKRNYEIIEVSKNLINKCCYYKVENFVVEDLNIKVCDRNKGKNYNRLCNNTWIRNKFLNNIQKRCKIFNINYVEVLPQYSSFTGNIIFRNQNLPDQVLSSIEISRRGYEFRHQYILKDKPQIKNIVKIDINNDLVFKELYIKSMEEFNIQEIFKDIVDTYLYFKRNSKIMYRVSLDNFSSFREFSTKQSRLLVYKFI